MKGDKNVDKPKKEKKKKLSKKWLVIPIIIGVVAGLFLFNGNETGTVNLFKEVELLREEKKPFVIILTDTNSQVARNEEKNIEAIRKSAPKGLSVFYVDRGKEKIKEGDYFIDTYKTIGLPSVVICNEQGDSVGTFMAPFDVEKIIAAMEALPLKNSEE